LPVADDHEYNIHLASVHKQSVPINLFSADRDDEEEKQQPFIDERSKIKMLKDHRNAHFPLLSSEPEPVKKNFMDIPASKQKQKKKNKVVVASDVETPLSMIKDAVYEAQ